MWMMTQRSLELYEFCSGAFCIYKKGDNLFISQMLNSSSEIIQVCAGINLLCLLCNKVRQKKIHWKVLLSFENSFSVASKEIQGIQQWWQQNQSLVKKEKQNSKASYLRKKEKRVKSYFLKCICIPELLLLIESSVLQRLTNAFNSQHHAYLHGLQSVFSCWDVSIWIWTQNIKWKENRLDDIHLPCHKVFIFLGVLASHFNDIYATVSLHMYRLSIPTTFAGICLCKTYRDIKNWSSKSQ